MKKKLKEKMNKEEGFTLVELLAVIAILAIIVAIAVPSIGNVINKSQEKAEEAEIALIEDAAKLAVVSENVQTIQTRYIYVDDLVDSGYLDLDKESRGVLKDKKGAVKIANEGKKYTYEEKPGNIAGTAKVDPKELKGTK